MSYLTRKLVLALCLFGVAVSANAKDRGHHSDWRLGYGHDHHGIYRWDGHGWHRVPGSANHVGDGWVIGTDRRHGGYGIYRWNGYGWNRVSGGAVQIGGSYQRPWVINNRGEKYYWNGRDWDADRGQGRLHSNSSRGRVENSRDYRRSYNH